MTDQNDIAKLNEDITQWDVKNKSDIRNKMDSLGIKHSANSPNRIPLRQAFKSSLRKRADLIDRISYQMPRSAIFLHKGVSRGHKKDNPRKAKEWFNPVVDKNIDDLGNIVAEGQGNLIIHSIDIK